MTITPPKVVIIGRTNVGKSTLFNRLIEKQKSLVSDIPGTTRDRFEGDCIWRGQVIRLVDTGGLDVDQSNIVDKNAVEQTKHAIKEADVILFVVDLKSGMQKEDRDLAKLVSRAKAPVIVAGNKADTKTVRAKADDAEWFRWEFGSPNPISSTRGVGTGDLLDLIYEKLAEIEKPAADIEDVSNIRVAVLGRPNIGKSSLLNAVIGHHRFITSDEDHTTREPNDSLLEVDGHSYLFIDTAGVRKMARIHAGKSQLESAGVRRSIHAVERAHVVLFVIDISKSIHSQDKHLGGLLADTKASVIIVANKWDLIPDKDPNTINKYQEYIRAHLPMLDFAPIVFTAANTGKRVQGIFDVIDTVYKNRFTELDHRETHKFISRAIKRHLPSRGKGAAHPRVTSFLQVRVDPPTFRLGIKQEHKQSLNDSYLRFLENLMRKHYPLEGTPMRIFVSTREHRRTITGKEYDGGKEVEDL